MELTLFVSSKPTAMLSKEAVVILSFFLVLYWQVVNQQSKMRVSLLIQLPDVLVWYHWFHTGLSCPWCLPADIYVSKSSPAGTWLHFNDCNHTPRTDSNKQLNDEITRFKISQCSSITCVLTQTWIFPDSKIHGANMGPTLVLLAPGGPHVGPINLAFRVASLHQYDYKTKQSNWKRAQYFQN